MKIYKIMMEYYEAYVFRDGVTVEVQGFKHRNTDVLSEYELWLSFNSEIMNAKKYARICSTTREEYISYTNENIVDVEGIKWLDIVREKYVEAWQTKNNYLIEAWMDKH